MRQKSKSLSKYPVMNKKNEQSHSYLIYSLEPKHLAVKKKRVTSLHKLQYKETPGERVQRQKIKYMKPLNDVELIMKKFDEVVKQKRQFTQTPKKNPKLQKMFETQLDKKIKGLLSLPTVKKIKQKAKTPFITRTITEPQTAVLLFNQGARLNILRQYDQYIKNSSKPVHKQLQTIMY